MEGRNSSMAIRIIQWVAYSYRTLKSYEVLSGIAFRAAELNGSVYRPACTTLNEKSKIHEEVLDLCKPLIEDGPLGTIDFVHFSAKEYDRFLIIWRCLSNIQ
jgi:hypothetical protein